MGRSLALRVTLTRAHFRDATETIAVPGPVTSVPTVRVRTEVSRKRVVVNLKVKAPGVRAPDGAIAVSVGKRTVTGQIDHGVARLVVRGLRPGVKPVVVRYAGSELVQPAVSRSKLDVPPRRP